MTDPSICLVTGGGGPAIGQGICRALAQAGWRVIVADLDLAAAEAVAAACGAEAVAMRLDVTDDARIESLVAELLSTHGRLDGLVNSAGIGLVRPLGKTTRAEFDRIIAVDLASVWSCAKAVLPTMIAQGHGSIVNIASNHAVASSAGYGAYAAAKAGVLGLTRGLALDYGRYGIRCNAVLPGLVDGASTRAHLETAGLQAEQFVQGWLAHRQLLPRPIDPIDIGNVVEFLLSDRSRAVTGAALLADAGTSTLLFDQQEDH